MRMNQDERRFDFHGLGLALKQAREEKGWTQAYVAELVGKTDRTIMNIENKGQRPSFNLFFKLVTLFDISVYQFFYTEGQRGENSCRKHIDVLLARWMRKSLLSWRPQPKGSRKPEKRRFKRYGCFASAVCTGGSNPSMDCFIKKESTINHYSERPATLSGAGLLYMNYKLQLTCI